MHHRSTPYATAALALACATAAHADVLPITMNTTALSRSCIVDCQTYATWTADQDSADMGFGSFASHDASASVPTGGNAFAAAASADLVMNGNTGFTLHQVASHVATGEDGSVEADLRTRFSFQALADGTMTISYTATYQRLAPGPWLNAGVSFSSPSDLVGFGGGHSIDAVSYDSLSGTVGGSWSYALTAGTYYSLELATGINTSFHIPGGAPSQLLDVAYTVSLPTITAAVPEPSPALLLLAGLAVGGGLWRRQSERSSA